MNDLSSQVLLLAEISPPAGFSSPDGEPGGWPYLAVCAVFFLTLGMVTGYFIWRKGNHQTLDAEAVIRKTGEELSHLREDLQLEIIELGTERRADKDKSGKQHGHPAHAKR